LPRLKPLIPKLVELVLNNVDLVGGWAGEEDYAAQRVLEEILHTTAYVSTKLMKLKVSNMNLRGDRIVRNVCETLNYNKNMILLDVSWGKMLPKHLADLAEALAMKSKSLRNLNLSYNSLNFGNR